MHDKSLNWSGKVKGLSDSEVTPIAEEDMDHCSKDDTNVPLHNVIKATVGALDLGADVDIGHEDCFLVESVTKDSDGALVASGDDEDVWAYNDQGKKWRSLGELPTAALDESLA